jgi:hypothetical protein
MGPVIVADALIELAATTFSAHTSLDLDGVQATFDSGADSMGVPDASTELTGTKWNARAARLRTTHNDTIGDKAINSRNIPRNSDFRAAGLAFSMTW